MVGESRHDAPAPPGTRPVARGSPAGSHRQVMSRERRLSANGSRRAPQRRALPEVRPVSPSKAPMVSVMDRRPPATQGTSGVFPVSLSKRPMVSVMDRRLPATQGTPGVFPVSSSKRPMVWVMDRQFPATQGTPGVLPVGPSKCPMVSVMDRQPSPSPQTRTLEIAYANAYNQADVRFSPVSPSQAPIRIDMGNVIPFPRRTDWEPELSKRQVAQWFGFSTRWVELRVREGMPSRMRGNRRRFLLSECEAWLARPSEANA